MKIVKPLQIGCLFRTYGRDGNRLAATGIHYFSFANPDRFLPEPEMWQTLSEELGDGSVWDMGIPKDRAEFLVSGRCFPPGRIPAGSRLVRVRVGPLERRLAVFGDRTWKRRSGVWEPTEPDPFDEMPLDWTRAFGGPGFSENPLGKGFFPGSPEESLSLPNVEDPARPVVDRDDRPEPAGLGPVDLTRPRRMARFGKYLPGEIGKTPPGLPSGIDWTVFNQSTPEQWLGVPFFRPGEAFSIEGMHPEIPVQEGKLPDLRLRGFAAFGKGSEELFVEIPMGLETVWLFPHRETGIAIHRGSVPVISDDASDVRVLLLGAEGPEERRTPDHYRAVLRRRENREGDDPERLSDVPLLPTSLAEDPEANRLNLRYQREQALVASPGKTGGPPPVLDLIRGRMEEMKSHFSGISAEAAGALESTGPIFEAAIRRLEEEGKAFGKNAPPPAPGAPLPSASEIQERVRTGIGLHLEKLLGKGLPTGWEGSGLSPEELKKSVIEKMAAYRPPSSPPVFPTFDEVLEKIRTNGALAGGVSGPEPSSLEGMRERWEKARAGVLKAASLKTGPNPMAHFMPPPAPDPGSAAELRRRVEEQKRNGPDFRGWTLTGADLSSLDLSGADFTEADLSGANLSGADLSGARMEKAVLAHADLSNSRLDGAFLSGANLGFAILAGASATEIDGEKAIFQGADLTEADLSGANLSEADLSNAVFVRLKAARLRAHRLRFVKVPLSPEQGGGGPEDNRILFREVDFSGADLSRSLFLDADFEGVSFSGANLSRAFFRTCGGPATLFGRSKMVRTCFVDCRDFSRSDFRGADLSEGSFRGASLSGSDFTSVRMEGTDFSGADLSWTTMKGVVAVKARFVKTLLNGADLKGDDFREALFLKADLRGTSLSRSSAYRANFLDARTDGSTDWRETWTARALLPEENS